VALAALAADSDALIRSAGADSTVCAVRRSASPYFIWRQTLSCSGLPRLGRKKRVARMITHIYLSPPRGERSSREARRVRGRCRES